MATFFARQLYGFRKVVLPLLVFSAILLAGITNRCFAQNNGGGGSDFDTRTRRLKAFDAVSARHSLPALPAWARASSNNDVDTPPALDGGGVEKDAVGSATSSVELLKRIPQIADVRAECSNPDKMNIGLKLDSSFGGIIYAKGHFGKPECMFTKPHTKSSSFNFTAPVDICGTKVVDKQRNLKISSVVLQIQQDPIFVESSDYARDIRCTWSLRFDQVVTLKPFSVTDAKKPDRVEFSGDELSVMMDVRLGRNPFSGPSLGNEPVSLGTEMTIVVFVKSDTVEPHSIDVVVRDCQARDVEKGTIVPLTDENGCVLQPKLISPFRITMDVPLPGVALAAYAILQSFKFPDTPRVSLTCNVALCKESCGIECSATAGTAAAQQQQPARSSSSTVPQLTAAVPTQQQNQAISVSSTADAAKHRRKRDTSATDDKQQQQAATQQQRASRQLMGNNNNLDQAGQDEQHSTLSPSTSRSNTTNNHNITTTTENNQISDVDAFQDPHFINLSSLMRAQRIIFDPATRMQQVRVGHDIMVVADTKADQVHDGDAYRASRQRLLLKDRRGGSAAAAASSLFADDDPAANSVMDPALLAARATHLPNKALEEAPVSSDVRLAGVGGKPSDVTELKCADTDSNYNHWIIIAFLLVLLMLLLAIIVVLAMFINHYRNEAREAKQKYKLYGGGGGTATPATYYVASSSSPTYQVYASGCETRTHITSAHTGMKNVAMPITTPHLIASTNFQATNEIHPSAATGVNNNNSAYSTWTNALDDDEDDTVDDGDERNRRHHTIVNDDDFDDDTNTLRQRNNNIDDAQVVDFSTHMRSSHHGGSTNAASLASRSLCRSLPSLAGAFHDQQLTLVPIDQDDFSTATMPSPPRTLPPPPPPLSTMSAVSARPSSSFIGGGQAAMSEYETETTATRTHQPLPMPSIQAPLVVPAARNGQQQQFEGDDMNSIIMLRSSSPAKEECRSMASCVMTNADLLSTDGRATSVSTFRPSSLAERNKNK